MIDILAGNGNTVFLFADAERVLSKQELCLDNAHLTVKPHVSRNGK